MANKEIKTLNLNGNTYEIVDEAARASLSSHLSGTLAIAHGGTGANTAAQARHNIGADHVYNLLDNSDFRIAQAGYGGMHGTQKYVCDRWYDTYGFGSFSFDESQGLTIAYQTNHAYLVQKINGASLLHGKTVTLAIQLSDGTVYVKSGVFNSSGASFQIVVDNGKTFTLYYDRAEFVVTSGSMTVKWVALYEGSYTADTLPAYVPKGKHVEMLNCGVPLAPHNLLDNSDFRNPVNQRGIYDTTESENLRYTIDRWKSYLTSIDVSQTGMLLSGQYGSNYNTIYQYVPLTPDGRIYTAALYYTDGTVKCASGDFLTRAGGTGEDYGVLFEKDSGGNPYVQLYTYSGKRIIGAALYEGAYDASTLPAYQPKGYAAELAACQWYFERLGVADSEILGAVAFAKSGAKSVRISMQYQPKRVGKPTLVFSDVSKYRLLFMDAVNASVFGATQPSSFDEITVQSPFASVRVTMPNPLDRDCWVILQREDSSDGAYIDVNADL